MLIQTHGGGTAIFRKAAASARSADRPVIRICILAALLLGSAAAASAQQPSTIIGRVLSQTGEPLAGALVRLEGATQQVLSDSAGRYVLVRVPAGSHMLRAELLGYADTRSPVLVTAGRRITHDIRMAESALQLPGLVVTADPVSRGRGELATASVIEREAIRHQAAVSLAGLLELVPGVPLAPPGLESIQQISLRTVPVSGLGGDALGASTQSLGSAGTLIILDGVPLSNNANLQSLGARGEISLATSAGGGIDLRRIPASLLERVEVIRGVPSARHGDLTQGAIVVETRAGIVEPSISARADVQTSSAALVAGQQVGGPHIGTLQFDATRTQLSPGINDDDMYRLAGQLAHRYAAGRLTLDTRVDYFQVFQNSPEDTALAPGRASRSRDRGIRIAERARLRFNEEQFLELTASVEQQRQDNYTQQLRVRGAQPFTDRLDAGRSVGWFVGGPYVARVNLDGAPWLAFARLEGGRELDWLGGQHELRAGLILRREWNTGPGYRFDVQFPPQVAFNGVEGYDRPRRFDDVPALATSALYLDDRASWMFGRMHFMVQGGLRMDVLHEGTTWFSGSRDAALQPRLSVQLAPRSWFRLRGSAGTTTKHPTLAELNPASQYHDVVNVNWFANDPAERLAVLTTFVLDPTNEELRQARTRMAEVGFEVEGFGSVLSVVAFEDRTNSGIGLRRTPGFILRDHYQLSDSSSGTGRPPEIIEPAFRSDTVPVLLLQPDNTIQGRNHGYELTLTLPEVPRLGTRFDIQGAWVRSELTSSGLEVGSGFSEFQLGTRTRTPYWEGTRRTGERFLMNYRLVHQQPAAGLVATITVQHVVRDGRRNVAGTDSLAHAGYITRAGQVVPVPPADRALPEYADIRRTRTGLSTDLQDAPADWLLSLQVSKTLPLDGRLAFYAFNAFNRAGQYGSLGQQTRPFAAMRFGMDVSLTPWKYGR
jgi:hypothetical protein